MKSTSIAIQKKPLTKKEWVLWIVFLFIGLMIAIQAGRKPSDPTPSATDIESLETLIPAGHLLIPIEVANAERLEGVLGANGIVDLYESPTQPGARVKLVGRRLRILRAPLNPQAFAVLVRDSEVDQFLSTQGPYVASLRPLQEKSHEVAHSSSGPRIEYHRETP